VKTLPVPAKTAIPIVGASHKVSQKATTRIVRDLAGRAWSGLAKQAFAVELDFRFAMSDPARECWVASACAKKPDETCLNDDERKRDGEEKDGYECSRRQSLQRSALKGAPADSDHGFDDDHQNGRLQTKESGRHVADFAPFSVDDAESHQRDDAWQDEQPTRHQAAAHAMHQPADVRGELLRLGSGQKHAVVERMQEPALRHPSFFFDENAVHDGDLPGRAAEAQRRDTKPDAKGFSHRNAVTSPIPTFSGRQSKRIGHVRPPSC
jgi:hypothetical protein